MDENQMSSQAAAADRKPKVVRDVFFNLATMSALYTALTSLIFLVFAILDTALPDEFTCGGCDNTYTITYYMSLVIVSYVLYAYFSWRMRNDEGVQAMHHTSIFHQVVVYITLFLMGLAIAYQAADLINTTVYYGVTAASFVKFLAIVLVAGSVFGYHLIDLKRSGDVMHSKIALSLWWVLAAVVAGSVIGSFLVIGSPQSQKERRFDEIRSDDLSYLQSDIEDYAYTNYALPENLSELTQSTYYDPQSGQPYEYKATGDATYTLCADFSRSSTDDFQKQFAKVYGHTVQFPDKNTNENFYSHDRGRTCYKLTDSDLLYSSSAEYDASSTSQTTLY